MIKIQLLLRHPTGTPELDAGLRDRCEQLGIHVVSAGRVTLSAEVSEHDYQVLFRARPPGKVRPEDTPELPVPATLIETVTLITVAPQHVLTDQNGKANNAAI